MDERLILKQVGGLLSLNLKRGIMIIRYLLRVAVVSAAVLSVLVNGQYDVYTKRLYILKTALLHLPSGKHALSMGQKPIQLYHYTNITSNAL